MAARLTKAPKNMLAWPMEPGNHGSSPRDHEASAAYCLLGPGLVLDAQVFSKEAVTKIERWMTVPTPHTYPSFSPTKRQDRDVGFDTRSPPPAALEGTTTTMGQRDTRPGTSLLPRLLCFGHLSLDTENDSSPHNSEDGPAGPRHRGALYCLA